MGVQISELGGMVVMGAKLFMSAVVPHLGKPQIAKSKIGPSTSALGSFSASVPSPKNELYVAMVVFEKDDRLILHATNSSSNNVYGFVVVVLGGFVSVGVGVPVGDVALVLLLLLMLDTPGNSLVSSTVMDGSVLFVEATNAGELSSLMLPLPNIVVL